MIFQLVAFPSPADPGEGFCVVCQFLSRWRIATTPYREVKSGFVVGNTTSPKAFSVLGGSREFVISGRPAKPPSFSGRLYVPVVEHGIEILEVTIGYLQSAYR